jgi:hypothetical protein
MSTPEPRTTALAASRGHTRRPKIRRPEAGRCWAEAKEAAELIGVDRDDYRLCFGPTNVNIWSVGLAVEMLDGTEAIKRAEKFRLPRSAPRERVGHHWIDLARGYLLHGDHQRALVTLQQARRTAPQQTRYHRRLARHHRLAFHSPEPRFASRTPTAITAPTGWITARERYGGMARPEGSTGAGRVATGSATTPESGVTGGRTGESRACSSSIWVTTGRGVPGALRQPWHGLLSTRRAAARC